MNCIFCKSGVHKIRAAAAADDDDGDDDRHTQTDDR
jgi:hypothetical protein